MSTLQSVRCFDLPYRPDSVYWFERLRTAGHAVWLDSNHEHHADRNHTIDLMSAAPFDWVLCSHDGSAHDKQGKTLSGDSVLDAFKVFSDRYRLETPAHAPCVADLPPAAAAGYPGFFGFISYEAGYSLQHLQHLHASPPSLPIDNHSPTMPLLYFGFYPWVLINDHAQQRCQVIYAQPWISEEVIRHYLDATPSPRKAFVLSSPWHPNTSLHQYHQAIDRIHDYLHNGDCYQVNYAQGFSARYEGDPLEAYQRLRQAYPAPYSAFIEMDEGSILSVSPELFLRVRGREVVTKPIKGTRPRSPCPVSDSEAANALVNSAKDRSENVMIVDLMRNDLARCCVPGSISVPALFEVEQFRAVHHMVSTVTGQLRPECSINDLLAATFPGGSITGAPKRRAMEIIHELEAEARQVYCGAIGRIGLDQSADFNIAIRTAVCNHSTIKVWGGGGIVMASQAEAEYQESLDKISAILDCLHPGTPQDGVHDQ